LRATGHKRGRDFREPQKIAIICLKFGVHPGNVGLKAGIMLGGGGLRPTSQAKRVRFSSDKRTVIDGPFAPTQEQIAGYWLWEVKSIDEAVEWLKRCPNPMLVDSEIEIRPEFEAADFAE
jgi:hypothetical protein